MDPIDPLVDEAHYQGLGNMLAGFFVSVGLLAMVVASLWVQPSLAPSERLVGGELWAVVIGCALGSLGAHIVFTRPRVHVQHGIFTLIGAVRELSFPVRDIALVGTRFGYARLCLRNGQRIPILGLDAAPVRVDAELERFLRDFKAALSRTGEAEKVNPTRSASACGGYLLAEASCCSSPPGLRVLSPLYISKPPSGDPHCKTRAHLPH